MDASSLIQAVCLDVWETMLFERDGFDTERHQIRCMNLGQALDKFGIRVSIKKLDLILDSMRPWFSAVWGRDEDVTHLDQLRFIVKAASGGSIEMREEWVDSLSKAYTSAFYQLPPSLNQDTPPLLRWLENQDIRIGIISNTGRTPGFALRGFLNKKELAEYFDMMIFSDEVGIRKPNPEIFYTAAREIGIDPGNIVHIGDSLRSDVWGAKNAGMMALCFSNAYDKERFPETGIKSLAPLEERWSEKDPRTIEPEATITSLTDTIKVIKQLNSELT